MVTTVVTEAAAVAVTAAAVTNSGLRYRLQRQLWPLLFGLWRQES